MSFIAALGAATGVAAPTGGLRTVDDIDSRHATTFGISPSGPARAGGTAAVDDGGFESLLTGAVNDLAAGQRHADQLAVAAAVGDPNVDVHDVTIAQTEAALNIELAVTFRNAAVNAFNEILRTPL